MYSALMGNEKNTDPLKVLPRMVRKIIKLWLQKTIIGLNLCPFARHPFDNHLIKIVTSSATDEDQAFYDLVDSLASLSSITQQHLIFVLPCWGMTFKSLVQFCYDLEKRTQEVHFNHWLFIPFHPQFKFSRTSARSRSHLVNSSPYPLIHVLPKFQMDMLDITPRAAREISLNNEEKLRQLSKQDLAEHYYWLYH